MSVQVRSVGDKLEFGTESALFKILIPPGEVSYPGLSPYDVAPDGKRILALAAAGADQGQHLVVLSNWAPALRE